MQNRLYILLVLIFFASLPKAFGGAFLIYNQDAAANALGLAYTAQVQNPSAVFYNPAAINQLKGTQYSSGGTMIWPKSAFRSSRTGRKTDQDYHMFYLPTFFVTRKVNEKWSLGLGSFSHFGLTTDWPSNWEGRYLSTYASLRTTFLNPVVSYQLTPRLFIAAGIQVTYSDVKQKKNIRITPWRDGRAKFEAYDVGWGYNLALLFRITNDLKFGLTYRSQIRMHYEGDADFIVPKVFKRIVPEGSGSVDIDLPAIVTSGFSYTLLQRWTIELDIIWVDWNTYEKLAVKLDKSVPKFIAGTTAPVIRDYHNTLDFAFGISFRATDSFTVRAGYLFDPSPVPEENVDPILPGAHKNIYAAGLGYKKGKWSIDVAGYFTFYKDRHVRRNRDGFNGKYESFATLIGLNIHYCP